MKTKTTYPLLVIILLMSSCDLRNCLSGEGPNVDQTIELSQDITQFNIQTALDIELSEGNTQEIMITGPQNMIDALLDDSNVSGNTWNLNIEECTVSKDLIITAQIKELEAIYIDGSAKVVGQNTFTNIDDLDIEIDGSGDIELNVEQMDKLRAEIDGSGTIQLEGSAVESVNKIDGSGKFYLRNLMSLDASIKINGSGKAELNASESVNIEIDGSGDVCYVGSPELTITIDGSGSTDECN